MRNIFDVDIIDNLAILTNDSRNIVNARFDQVGGVNGQFNGLIAYRFKKRGEVFAIITGWL